MLGYATIGTKDMDRAVAFYDALLGEVGASQLFGMDRIKFYGTGEGTMLAIFVGMVVYLAIPIWLVMQVSTG